MNTYYRLHYSIHKTNDEEAKRLALREDGIFSPNTRRVSETEDFNAYEIYFKSLNQCNAFIYFAMNSFGVYFYIEQLIQSNYIT